MEKLPKTDAAAVNYFLIDSKINLKLFEFKEKFKRSNLLLKSLNICKRISVEKSEDKEDNTEKGVILQQG